MLFIKFASALLSLHAISKVCMCSVKFPCFLLTLHAYYIKYACYLTVCMCSVGVFMFSVQFARVLY